MSHVICDLDGVLYRGGAVVEGASESLHALDAANVGITFATNNSSKTPEAVADKITELTGFETEPGSVVTSSMAAAAGLGPDDGPVMVVGESGVYEAVKMANLEITTDWLAARTLIVGLNRDFDYRLMADAAHAVRNGARFLATNTDTTFPTAIGLDPGSGAIVASIQTAAGVSPEVAGKPNQAMVRLLTKRVDGEAWVIGDRLDTDIRLASQVPNWTSILVLTGVTSKGDQGIHEADHVVPDLRAAVDLVLQDSFGS